MIPEGGYGLKLIGKKLTDKQMRSKPCESFYMTCVSSRDRTPAACRCGHGMPNK